MDIYQTWHCGIDGFPGVLALTNQVWPGWKIRAERNCIAIRQNIYTEMFRRAESSHIPLESAAWDMDQERMARKNSTIDNYGKHCKQLDKDRTALTRLS